MIKLMIKDIVKAVGSNIPYKEKYETNKEVG